MLMPLKYIKTTLPDRGRTVVISDVHGNLACLEGLLKKLALTQDDFLVFDGDLLEKGSESLAVLRYVMALCEQGRAMCVCGNCDCWHLYTDYAPAGVIEFLRRYLVTKNNGWGDGFVAQLCHDCGIEIREDMDIGGMIARLTERYAREFDFLRSLPQVVETEDYIFVHGGLPEGETETWDGWHCMKYDRYLDFARDRGKWQIVGHTPVVLYGEDTVCANPIIDRDRRVVSIDGGCSLKDDGQLNALILPKNGEDFSFVSFDGFPTRRVRFSQEGSEHSAYIRWGDNEVEVIERGDEFSRCRHVRTGYELDILTKYLSESDGRVFTNDCTDYVLPLEAGDEISVVEETSRGYFAKHGGVSGWVYE